MRGLGDFQRAQMKHVDPRLGQFFSHFRQALDLMENILVHPYAPPKEPKESAQPAAVPAPRVPIDAERRAYGVSELAKLLGIGQSTIWKAIKERRLRHVKIG